jgi:Protein of unknown function (DUF3592)
MKIFVLVFGGIGVILLALAGFFYMREVSFLKSAQTASGTVIDYELSHSTDNSGSTYCPVIDFTTNAGERVKYYANVCSSPPAYDMGDEVQVLYDPQDIKNVQMKSFWSQYVGVFVLACVGAPFFLLGVWGLFAKK